jgi:HTH-type transcriptional regulator / antitoxin HigA
MTDRRTRRSPDARAAESAGAAQAVTNQYRPSTVTPPGDTIAELLEERELRQTELATRMGVTPKFVNELIGGKATIAPGTALALERALDVPADFWLAREAKYRGALARKESRTELIANVSWLDQLPLKDMRDFGWIEDQEDKPSYVEKCLQYFGVASVPAWREQYLQQTTATAAYRASEKVRANPGAVATWLRQGEIEAAGVECSPFDREEFMQALDEVHEFTLERDPKEFIPKLQKLFADCGVALVIVRAPKGCPIHGAVRWLSPQKAVIQLSFRYLRDDTFWFTLFHECGHIALHGKKILFLEGEKMESEEEDEANRFAADRLIPPHEWAKFQPYVVTEAAIREFAESVKVPTGIVLGRLQHERRVPWNRLAHLRTRYKWVEEN